MPAAKLREFYQYFAFSAAAWKIMAEKFHEPRQRFAIIFKMKWAPKPPSGLRRAEFLPG
ncbi:hypothetical protein [Candidatus Methylomicrobium oryzae]|jgi:hypothetical protein|uniref:hypothetical protein n=1 Tax=Candidatus Methylomicrobium oryzae TaxID=2802053 RepID=UPI001924196D|nr:hypothetical protein [Methylomicrobium sp. RS1]MBL1262292.1 hypothetical protein [Methylomicrobium sp. RS1]